MLGQLQDSLIAAKERFICDQDLADAEFLEAVLDLFVQSVQQRVEQNFILTAETWRNTGTGSTCVPPSRP